MVDMSVIMMLVLMICMVLWSDLIFFMRLLMWLVSVNRLCFVVLFNVLVLLLMVVLIVFCVFVMVSFGELFRMFWLFMMLFYCCFW